MGLPLRLPLRCCLVAEGPYGSNAEGCAAGLPSASPHGALIARGCTAPGCSRAAAELACGPCTRWADGGRVIRVLEIGPFSVLACYMPLANSAAVARAHSNRQITAHSIKGTQKGRPQDRQLLPRKRYSCASHSSVAQAQQPEQRATARYTRHTSTTAHKQAAPWTSSSSSSKLL